MKKYCHEKRFPDSRDPRYRASPRKTRHIRECLVHSEEHQICRGNQPIACSRCSDNRARSSDGGERVKQANQPTEVNRKRKRLGRIQVFIRGGSMKYPPPPPRRVVWGYPSPENFEILSARKCDFSHCEAQLGYEFIAFKIGCIYFIFLQVLALSCFNLGGSIDPPSPRTPPRSALETAHTVPEFRLAYIFNVFAQKT